MWPQLTRIHGAANWRAALQLAHNRIGPEIAGRLRHVQYHLGADPLFTGLHRFSEEEYDRRAHCCWPEHVNGPADRRVTTVVIPVWYGDITDTATIIVHELGHALDWHLGFDRPEAVPVSEYAHTDTWEAFAEAFTSWAWRDPLPGYRRPDDRTHAFFDALATAGT